MKKQVTFVLAIFLIFAFTGCRAQKEKKDIFNFVESNYDAILKACAEKDEAALLAIDGVREVNIVGGYVIVYCKGAGIASSSQDYGFYYSVENIPVTVNCGLDIVCDVNGLTREGDGFQCVVDGNTFYTEHIKGNVYFYSTAY